MKPIHILKDINFLTFWLAHVISSIGNTLIPVTITFAVLEVTGSATSLGLVLGALWITRVLFVMFGGVWADRISRKSILICSDLLQGANHLTIAFLFFTHSIELWHLVISALLYGAVSAFHSPASGGLIPQIAKENQLQQANSLLSIVNSILEIAGPAVAGILVVMVGFDIIFFIDAMTFFVSLILMLLVTPKYKLETTVDSSYWQDLKEGIHLAKNQTWIWKSLITFAMINFAVAAFNVLGPIALLGQLNGPKEWGMILTAASVGGLLGGLISHNFKPKNPLKFAFSFMTVLVPLQILMLLGPASHWLIMVVAMFASASIILSAVFWDTLVQQKVPEHMLSRIGSLDSFVSFVFMPIGFVLAGPISEVLGLTWTLLLLASSVFIINMGIIYFKDVGKGEFDQSIKAEA
ncbi:MFS transporter [Rossellomorea arthrocnemi]|uniref:MFS transporter n=1 Tax=Rossellomorea arthrocnemi TaxID=2769542 RepID=UPI001919F8C4|nr:MFS transporter [Rossellomorea arthrocnemi]